MQRATAIAGTVLFSFVVPAAVGGWVPWLLPHGPLPSALAWPWVGFLAVTFGAILYAWCATEFARSQGTPLPGADTATLVAKGPYRWVRNPMYVAVLSAIVGWAALLRSPAIAIYAVGVGLVMHSFVVLVEEPRLLRRFGASFSAYKTRVPRWMPCLPGDSS